MRLFIAVELEDSLKKRVVGIEEALEKSGADVRFVKKEHLHITLKFLGEIEESRVSHVEELISKVLEGQCSFKVSLEGAGYFGNHNYVRTLWVGIKEGRDSLVSLVGKMNRGLDSIRKDSFKPNPHLTVGRSRSGKNRESLLRELESLESVKLGEMDVKEVKLKKSELGKSGPIYTDLKVFGLK